MSEKASIFQFKEYRTFLKLVLDQMKERNPQFSLRALARKLELPPSFLSEVLSGKKNLSLDKALNIGRLLNLNVKETTFLCYLVALETCSDPVQKANLMLELETFAGSKPRQEIDLKRFEVISNWESIALLELLTVYPEKPNQFYQDELGLSQQQVVKIFINLESIRLVQKSELGFSRTSEALFVASQNHHLAMKMYHCSMLEKARYAIYNQHPSKRYTGTETLMIDPALLPEAHVIMNECLDRLLVVLKRSKDKTSLVHINFNLFELNNAKKKVGS